MSTFAWVMLAITAFLVERLTCKVIEASRPPVWPPVPRPQAAPSPAARGRKRKTVDPVVSEALAALRQLGHSKREAQSLIDQVPGSYPTAQALIAAVYQK